MQCIRLDTIRNLLLSFARFKPWRFGRGESNCKAKLYYLNSGEGVGGSLWGFLSRNCASAPTVPMPVCHGAYLQQIVHSWRLGILPSWFSQPWSQERCVQMMPQDHSPPFYPMGANSSRESTQGLIGLRVCAAYQLRFKKCRGAAEEEVVGWELRYQLTYKHTYIIQKKDGT